MRIVMPLFDFINESEEEFEFLDGAYAIQRNDLREKDPRIAFPGISELDRKVIAAEKWALVAHDPDLNRYAEEVNLLLLSFKIFTLGRLFIKFRICDTDSSLSRIINDRMTYIPSDASSRLVTRDQLEEAAVGFNRLREMHGANLDSNRTHNAIFFLYTAYFSTAHAMSFFVLLFIVLEALFSKDQGGSATATICERVSAFLEKRERCTYRDIEKLYQVRSELVHGRRLASDAKENLAAAHELEFVVAECMKKILDDRLYNLYNDPAKREEYFERLKQK